MQILICVFDNTILLLLILKLGGIPWTDLSGYNSLWWLFRVAVCLILLACPYAPVLLEEGSVGRTTTLGKRPR